MISVIDWDNLSVDMVSNVWAKIEQHMILAIAKYGDPDVVDGNLEFHRHALESMVAAGFKSVRYIFVDDGAVALARSGGFEEHWFFIGGLLNCSYEPPCTPEQLLLALPHIPCVADPYIHPRALTACQLVPSDTGCEFKLPASLDEFIQEAPAKYRSEWRRIMRKADAAGIQMTRVDPAIAFAACDHLIDQYVAYWEGKHDSYSDESVMMHRTVQSFRRAYPSQWLAIVITKDGIPVAVNFAWTKRGIVYDTICVRDVADDLRPYSLGVLAILANIGAAIESGMTSYSLAAGDQHYKKQFSYGGYTAHPTLDCISNIDVVMGQYPGYYNGVWHTEDNPVVLDEATVQRIHAEYPFTRD